MTIARHIRRPEQQARSDRFWRIGCDCGWEGQVYDGTKAQVEARMNTAFLGHLADDERRTYLLMDTRPPLNPRRNEPGEPWTLDHMIEGNYLMPQGEAVEVVSSREVDGVHYGTWKGRDGQGGELPIGEVRTPDGRTFRLA